MKACQNCDPQRTHKSALLESGASTSSMMQARQVGLSAANRASPSSSASESIAWRLQQRRPHESLPQLTGRTAEPQRKRTRTSLSQPEAQGNDSSPPGGLCSVCLCDFDDGDGDFGTTHCGHTFHTACLARWMLCDRRHTCPECRSHIASAGSRSRMFVASNEERPQSSHNDKRLPRFHGG